MVCSGQKNPLYAVVQGVAEDMRADTRSGRTKAIAAFLCTSAESEPSLNGSLLSQIQLVSFFHTSSFQVVIIRFRWCVDAKICGMFVCEIKPIVWRIFLEISAKTIDSIPYLYKGSVQKSRSFWRFGLCVTEHSDDGTHGRNFQHRRFSK